MRATASMSMNSRSMSAAVAVEAALTTLFSKVLYDTSGWPPAIALIRSTVSAHEGAPMMSSSVIPCTRVFVKNRPPVGGSMNQDSTAVIFWFA